MAESQSRSTPQIHERLPCLAVNPALQVSTQRYLRHPCNPEITSYRVSSVEFADVLHAGLARQTKIPDHLCRGAGAAAWLPGSMHSEGIVCGVQFPAAALPAAGAVHTVPAAWERYPSIQVGKGAPGSHCPDQGGMYDFSLNSELHGFVFLQAYDLLPNSNASSSVHSEVAAFMQQPDRALLPFCLAGSNAAEGQPQQLATATLDLHVQQA